MMRVGSINHNGNFVPDKNYVAILKNLCNDNDRIIYSFKRTAKSACVSCTVSVSRLNSLSKPKQETSDVVCNENMAKCLAAAKMIQRLEASAATKGEKNFKIKPASVQVEEPAKEKDTEKEEKIGNDDDNIDDNDLVFDYSKDFEQKKLTSVKKKQQQDFHVLIQPKELQPYEQFCFSSYNVSKETEFSFECESLCELGRGQLNFTLEATRPLSTLFGDRTKKFRISNVNYVCKNAIIGTVYSKNGNKINLKLLPPHEGYITISIDSFWGKTLRFADDEKIAMNFE